MNEHVWRYHAHVGCCADCDTRHHCVEGQFLLDTAVMSREVIERSVSEMSFAYAIEEGRKTLRLLRASLGMPREVKRI